MKRLLSTLLCGTFSLCALTVMAAEDALDFPQSSYDFGTICSADGAVSHEYKFVNNGKEPIAILTVTNGGCGCTTPSFPRRPIAPGDSGVIKITFDPKGRVGEFNREVKVRYSSEKKNRMVRLSFSGVIIPEKK